MILRNTLGLTLAINLLLVGSVHAAVIANLSFITPSDTVSPTDPIDVWVRLSLDSLSDPFTYDSSISPTAGLPTSLIPIESDIYDPVTDTLKTVPFDVYTGVGFSVGYGYQDNSFINSATGSAEYTYATNHYFPDTSIYLSDATFTLNAGESIDILHGTFTPKFDDNAAPDVYTFYNASYSLFFTGLSAEGESITAFTRLAETCPTNESSCAFTRTVSDVPISAVPVPAAVWLFGSGLLGLIGLARRKKS